ncbi:MAG TPA: hypothetical protein QF698_10200, partial [Candidatus Marinimicrobia bacterium]|nr:hypothetical protein [Candidatus Neomarinimicrobiota bacterium]
MFKHILFLLILSLVFWSCAEDEEPLAEEIYIIAGRTVYIVGESYNSEGNLTACYWVNGVRVELPGGAWA